MLMYYGNVTVIECETNSKTTISSKYIIDFEYTAYM